MTHTAEQERAAIVAWLRKMAFNFGDGKTRYQRNMARIIAVQMHKSAKAIEKCHHLPANGTHSDETDIGGTGQPEMSSGAVQASMGKE